MAENKNTTVRKTPIRKCTGCAERFPKNTLVRVLRTPEGEIILDKTGKKSGRGAYICKSAACLKKARQKGRLSASLECQIPDGVYDRLEEEIALG